MAIRKWKDAFPMNITQSMRIKEHQLKADGNIIIIDNLEAGRIKIFEYIGGSLTIQPLVYGEEKCPNAVLVADAVINSQWKDDGVFIHKVSCEYGYEYLVQPMIYQILHFTDFYEDYRSVGMADREYEHWFPYAKEALADFHRANRVYEYQIQGRGLDG